MKAIIFIIFFFLITASGFVIQQGTVNVTTTSWNFTGNEFARVIIPNLGAIFMGVGAIALFLFGFKEWKR